VILNGVIEYFPNVDYLLRVLKGAVGLLAPGGFVFLGAIPNLAAQEILHVGGELSRAADSEDGATLRRRARNRMAADRRLLVTPEFFRELPNQIPEVTAVKVQALRGAFENEASQLLTDASFDVFLKTGAPPRETRTVHRLNWKTDSLDPDAVIDRVRAGGPSDVWWITDVPHDRMWAHGQLLAAWPGPGTTAAELRKRLATGMGGAAPGLGGAGPGPGGSAAGGTAGGGGGAAGTGVPTVAASASRRKAVSPFACCAPRMAACCPGRSGRTTPTGRAR